MCRRRKIDRQIERGGRKGRRDWAREKKRGGRGRKEEKEVRRR